MARITPQTARLLADELIKAGRARVGDRDSLIQRLIAQSAATGDAAPETAIGNALMVVPPRTVTPATPAPMQPGVPFVAPKPTAEMMPQPQEQELPVAPQRPAPRPSLFRRPMDSTLAEIGFLEGTMAQAASAGQKPNPMQQAKLDALKDRARVLQDYVQAEEGAELPEEVRSALESRQGRLTRREELLEEARARSPWEALLAGGAAMAQGRRGERFTEALARGLQTGLQEYGRARQSREQGADAIAEAREQVVMDRFNMLEKARSDARAMVNAGMEVDERTMRLAGMTRKEALETALFAPTVEKGEAEATLAKAKAAVAPQREQAEIREILNRGTYYGLGGGRGGGSRSDVEGRADRDELDDAAAEYEAARVLYNEEIRAINESEKGKQLTPQQKVAEVSSEVRNAYLAAKSKLEQRSRSFARRYGSSPYIGGQVQGANRQTNAIPADPLGIRGRT